MSALREFADRALETNRIGFGDLRRLQRDVLPLRITTTDEAELLLAIDGSLVRADRDWTDYLTDAVGEFTLWGMGPAGRITQAKADWPPGSIGCGASEDRVGGPAPARDPSSADRS
ncbi:hypothetical protein ABEG18_19105 [Alsobacter sp. KACC 23698]|uniref:Uncharacterized protein n=1 Tax=Alsobacter sp. KACC 23698 TaxID=3149229 RepID=A0AAU7JC90_9HYPH